MTCWEIEGWDNLVGLLWRDDVGLIGGYGWDGISKMGWINVLRLIGDS